MYPVQRHVVGFSRHSARNATVYFRFENDICREARILGQPTVNYCDTNHDLLPFVFVWKEFQAGLLAETWSEYQRPSGRAFSFIGECVQIENAPGVQYFRIARSGFAQPNDPPSYHSVDPRDKFELQGFLVELSSLLIRIREICRFVHPSADNLTAYGTEMADVLILACNSVEASLRGILIANDRSIYPEQRINTNDYVRLVQPLRLREYSVRFKDIPWILPVSPFSDWDSAAPTRSIPWYESYNKVKHDRYNSLSSANLGACLSSVAAVYILACAQFGYATVQRRYRAVSESVELEGIPKWSVSELYLAPLARAKSEADAPFWYSVPFFQQGVGQALNANPTTPNPHPHPDATTKTANRSDDPQSRASPD